MEKTRLVRGCIQAVYSSSRESFKKIFGDMGEYLFKKYTIHFDAREDAFICYLDDDNLTKLIEYVEANPDNYR